MIKILHIVSSTSRSSGVMNFIMNYYNKIDTSKIQFDFLYFYDVEKNFNKEIEKNGGNVYRIGMPKFKPSYFKKISKFFSNNNTYTAIHCHPIYSFIFFSPVAKKYGIKKIIQHSHSSKYSNKTFSSIRNYFILKFSRFFITNYIACSEEALKIIPKSELRKKGFIIINNAIDVEKYKYNEANRNLIRDEFNINKNDVVIGHVGRFAVEKNQGLLIDIFNEIQKNNKNYKMILVGDGPLMTSIRDKVSDYNLEKKVILTGVRSDVEKIMSAMDYFLFPSTFEGLGIVAIEAQAAGLITICSLGVPDTACLSPLSKKIDFFDRKQVNELIRELTKYKIKTRKDYSKLITAKNFNINYEVKKLEKFYTHLNEEVENVVK